MMKLFWRQVMLYRMTQFILAVAYLATFGATTLNAQKMTRMSRDETAIRKLIQQIQDGWNAHDPKAAAAPFAIDADFVVVTGLHLKGRDEIERGFAFRLSQPDYKASKNTITVKSIRFLRPDVAIVHTTFDIEYSEGGEIKRDHAIETAVVTKARGRWSIIAFQNTVVAPQQPPGFEPPDGY
jgi:uncharacterized protein (TIGR02246 family)